MINIKRFKSSLYGNSVIFTLFAILNNGLNFLLLFFLSGYLPKEDFGVLNLFLTIILIFSSVVSLGTQGYISIIYFKKSKDYINKIINSIFLISIIVYIFSLIIYFFLPTTIKLYLGVSDLYVFFAFTICFLQVFYTIILEIFRLNEQPVKYGFMTMLFVLLNILLTIYFCMYESYGWEGRAISQFLSSLICFFLAFYLLRKTGFALQLNFRKNDLKKILYFGLPLIPHSSTVWMRMGIDRYIVNSFYGASMLASFSFIYNFSGLILMIGTAFNASNSVFIYKNLKNDSALIQAKLRKQIITMSLIFMGITLISIFVVYLVIKIFVNKYIDAVPFIIPLFFAAFFQCIYYLFVNYLFYFKKTKLLMIITFSISLFHLLISFLITKYSVIGLAYLNLLSNFLICISVIYYSNKLYPFFKIARNEQIISN